MSRKTKVRTKEELIQTLKSDFLRWREIYTKGCSDPTYKEGINLDLVRNHIIYDLKQLVGVIVMLARENFPMFISIQYRQNSQMTLWRLTDICP